MKQHLVPIVLCMTLLATSSTVLAKPKKPGKNDYPLCGNRLQVSINDFKTENLSLDAWTDDIALNSREVAVDDLVNSPCFRVLERDQHSSMPTGIANEKKLARSQYGKKGSKVAKKHQMKIADYTMTYAVTGAKKGGKGFHFGWLTGIAGAVLGGVNATAGEALSGLDVAISKDHLSIVCRITDNKTSEILSSEQVNAKGTNVGVGPENRVRVNPCR